MGIVGFEQAYRGGLAKAVAEALQLVVRASARGGDCPFGIAGGMGIAGWCKVQVSRAEHHGLMGQGYRLLPSPGDNAAGDAGLVGE